MVAGGDRAILALKPYGPSTGTSEEALAAEHVKEQSPGGASSLAPAPLLRSTAQTPLSESSSDLHESEAGETLTQQ